VEAESCVDAARRSVAVRRGAMGPMDICVGRSLDSGRAGEAVMAATAAAAGVAAATAAGAAAAVVGSSPLASGSGSVVLLSRGDVMMNASDQPPSAGLALLGACACAAASVVAVSSTGRTDAEAASCAVLPPVAPWNICAAVVGVALNCVLAALDPDAAPVNEPARCTTGGGGGSAARICDSGGGGGRGACVAATAGVAAVG